ASDSRRRSACREQPDARGAVSRLASHRGRQTAPALAPTLAWAPASRERTRRTGSAGARETSAGQAEAQRASPTALRLRRATAPRLPRDQVSRRSQSALE